MIKVVVDSGCDFHTDFKKQIRNNEANIKIVPLNLQLEEKYFLDDDNLDINNYIAEMEKIRSFPRTAAPSPENYMEMYKGDEDSVFAVVLSSRLSGSYNSAILAKELYKELVSEGVKPKFIHVFDSLSASVGEMLIALKINEFYKNNLSDTEIVDSINNFIKQMKTYFLLEKYDTAVKSGRMNPYVAKIASLLSIKPICGAIDGKMEVIDKARGNSNALKRLIEIMLKDGNDFENRILGISHVKCLDKAILYKEEILKKIKFKEVIICEASGLVSTYASNGGIVLAF